MWGRVGRVGRWVWAGPRWVGRRGWGAVQWLGAKGWQGAGRVPVPVYALVSFVVLVLLPFLWYVPIWMVGFFDGLTVEQQAKLEDDYRKTIAQIVGGIVLVVGVYFTWRNSRASEVKNDIDRERQITERFTKAIEQLASDSLGVRLGGIYALERIAHESERDHWPIMETLTAYVREKSPAPDPDEVDEVAPGRPQPPGDIAAILAVIGRRVQAHDRGRIDLRNTSINIRFPEIADISLEKGRLQNSFLVGARFFRVAIGEADFESAYMDDIRFSLVSGKSVSFGFAKLHGARFMNCGLPGAGFYSVRGVRTGFDSCMLDGAKFTFDVELPQARFLKCSLKGADFQDAVLHKARFTESDLEGARLHGTRLEGADLSTARNLTVEQLAQARIDETTLLPPGLTHPMVRRAANPDLYAALESNERTLTTGDISTTPNETSPPGEKV
jgi:uncharacterized protein YjbI with pentapeptide repeats